MGPLSYLSFEFNNLNDISIRNPSNLSFASVSIQMQFKTPKNYRMKQKKQTYQKTKKTKCNFLKVFSLKELTRKNTC